MKPTKNRVFCYDCGRQKMVFETERKANTFIKFNSDEIEIETGHAPTRGYFCIACNGWHVTSKNEVLNIKSKTEIVLEEFEQKRKLEEIRRKEIQIKKKEELKILINEIQNKIDNIKKSLDQKDECFKLLKNTFDAIERAKGTKERFKGSLKKIKKAESELNLLSEKLNA
jgi:hypothetical protein